MADQHEVPFAETRYVEDAGSPELLSDGEIGPAKEPPAPLAAQPKRERAAVVAAAGFQLVVLLAMILGHTMPYRGAQTLLLQVEPVDPRDLFRGDYVILGYTFSRIPTAQFPPGSTVYVTLVPEGPSGHHRAGDFLTAPPTAGPYIRGTAQNYGRAAFGIESFYVQEGKGHDYERAVRDHRLWAEVALDSRGNAALRRLVME